MNLSAEATVDINMAENDDNNTRWL